MLVNGAGGDPECISCIYQAREDYQMCPVSYSGHGDRKRNRSAYILLPWMVGKSSLEGEGRVDRKKQQEAYENYVKKKTPVHNLPVNMTKAFITGGIICVIGQSILNYCEKMGLDKDISGGWTSMILILLSVVLTALNVYPRIAKWGGAGALVPITGFANSVAAPAIEFQKEGQVMGIGCKIFTIAGPVILYGIFTSWVLGFLYWIGKIAGIF